VNEQIVKMDEILWDLGSRMKKQLEKFKS
jgi:hypothetical protein